VAGPLARTGHNGAQPQAAARLSSREREVLQLIAEGVRTPQIAERLQISPRAVTTHRRNIKRKLGLDTIAELTRYAIRDGLVEP
jgi:DNA-binding NarL/FixJ family response regulator